MIHLLILGGAKTGQAISIARLPVQVGRAADADLSLDEAGLWPHHFQIARQEKNIVCQAEKDALLYINGVQTEHGVLRNGDIISAGALKMQFALAPVRQSSLRPREYLVWAGLILLCLSQVYLAILLIR